MMSVQRYGQLELLLLVQGWLVVLELYDQVDLGLCAGFEGFL
jgi:hypothetical protein